MGVVIIMEIGVLNFKTDLKYNQQAVYCIPWIYDTGHTLSYTSHQSAWEDRLLATRQNTAVCM